MDLPGRVTPDERKQALEAIAAEVAVCTRCPLHIERIKAVPGEGHPETEVVFVGEGPGFNEDREGRPFVGAAGGLLNELLKAIGWRREEVFITNVVKCRPPGNRDPDPAEISACAPYLQRQLQVLDPSVVVTLGRHSLGTFMPGTRISAVHGTTGAVDPQTGAGNATTYAMYHPAAALRQGSLKETMVVDMAGLPEVLIAARERRAMLTTPEVAAFVTEQAPVPALANVPEVPVQLQPQPEPTVAPARVDNGAAIVELDSLETATVVATAPASSTEPQLELFG